MESLETKLFTYSSLNIILHSIILLTFLTLFFFLFISQQEKSAFQNEIGSLINTYLTQTLDKIPKSQLRKQLKSILPQLDSIKNLYQVDNPYTSERNLLIKFSSGFLIILLVTILVSIISTLSIGCDRNLKYLKFIIIENLVIFSFVGLIEFFFFTKIAINYIPTTPSLMIGTLIDRMKDQLNTTS